MTAHKRVLLLGWPVAHSLSPRFQNAAFRAAGLPYTYAPEPLEHFDANHVGALLRASDVLGANVTLPHKEAVLDCVDELTPRAGAVGAVNTVYRRREDGDGAWLIGDNTDVGGFLADLRAARSEPSETAVVLGAGGAARAVVVALARRVRELIVINRTRARAEQMLRELGVTGRVMGWPQEGPGTDLSERLGRAELLVDTTSLGLGASPGEAAWRDAEGALAALGVGATSDGALFYDLKYGRETPFLATARALGRPARDGLGMLVAQGALAFERWTGQPAPVAAMGQAVGLADVPVLVPSDAG